jgi:hypothetical protein
MDMRCGTWNVRSLYRAGSLRRSDGGGGGTETAREYIFFYGKWNENYELGTSFFHT